METSFGNPVSVTLKERKMVGYAMSEARRGMPSPKREFRPGQKKTMTVEDAVPLLNAALVAMRSAVRITIATLNKIEQGKADVPPDLVVAAEKAYNQPEGRLTNVYHKNQVRDGGKEDETFGTSQAFLSSLGNRKRVIVRAIAGGGSVQWRADRDMGVELQVFSFLKDTDIVVLERPTFGYPKAAALAFEKIGEPQHGALILLSSKLAPNTYCIRLSDGETHGYKGEGDQDPLPYSDWVLLGWGFAWAARVGHSYPEWHMSELGMRPRQG